jgi:hypothetical protein
VFSQKLKNNSVILKIIAFKKEEDKDDIQLAMEQLNNIPGYK